MDILSVIQKKFPSLSHKEQLIGHYILRESSQIRNMNISVLATAVGVSDGTVTHFCKKVGCKSFADLKIQLGSAGMAVSTNSSLLSQVYEFYSTVISRSNQLISEEALLYLAQAISRAGTIHIYGVGSSGLTATELMLRLLRMGFHVQSVTDPHLMLINSSILSSDDLIIAISISGETLEVVRAARAAQHNQCQVICLTSYPESSLAQCCDFCLLVLDPLFVDKQRFVNSQFSALYAIDLLSTLLLQDETRNTKMNITVDAIVQTSHLNELHPSKSQKAVNLFHLKQKNTPNEG